MSLAQVVQGSLRDAVTGDPVNLAHILLVSQDHDTVAAALSDRGGEFRLAASAAGIFTLTIRRLGYRPLDGEGIRLGLRDTIRVAYRMAPLPVPLDPVLVEAEAYSRYLEQAGFYQRQRVGFGYHVDPATIDKWRQDVPRMADLLVRVVPGITVAYSGRPGSGPTVRISGCSGIVRYFVDDLAVNAPVDSWVSPFDVLALEVYRRGPETPARYSPYGGGCVVLIWTRLKETPDRNRPR